MASPLKTLVLRYQSPVARRTAAASSFSRCCSKASFSTAVLPTRSSLARPTSLRQQQQCTAATKWAMPTARRPLTRPNSDLAGSARKSLDANENQTASELARRKGDGSKAPVLDWDTFFKLRLKRRRVQLLFSVLSGFGGAAGGAIFLSSGLADPVVTTIPLDPFITLGLMTFACGGMGWLLGPSIGSGVFYILNRGLKNQMKQKEGQFFARVRKNRVDPTNSSAGNPVPDYYGEKIQSVAGYRRWLKDQRAFNKKKTANFV